MFGTWRVAPPKIDGSTRVQGVDLGAQPIWWEPDPKLVPSLSPERLGNGNLIVLKIPGSNYSNRGYVQYTGAYFQVLKVLRKDDQGNFVCEPVIDFPVRNGKGR